MFASKLFYSAVYATGLVFSLALTVPAARADNTSPSAEAERDSGLPRYRMSDQIGENTDNSRLDREPTESDFAWQNLTAGSPASGNDPLIGNRLEHSYYDFRDGYDLPKYVAAGKAGLK